MQDFQIQFPFTVWEILGGTARLAGDVWSGLTPGARLFLVLVLIIGFMLPPTKATEPALREGRRRFRRSRRRNSHRDDAEW